MKSELHNKLLITINELKQVVSLISLEYLLNFVNKRQYEFNRHKSKALNSPYQQCSYLLRIIASQSEPSNSLPFSSELDSKLCKLLNKIFTFYTLNFFTNDIETEDNVTENQVAMSAFIHYFFTSKSLNTHQIKDWILFWFKDDSTLVYEEFGFTIEDLIEFSFLLEDEIEKNLEQTSKDYEFLKSHKGKDTIDYKEKRDVFLKNSLRLFSIEFSKITKKISEEKLKKILKVFSLKRGEAEEITYLTDKNPSQFKSLFVDKDRIYYVANNSFYISIIHFLENFLYKEIKSAQKNIQNRDKKLETKTTELFKRLCSGNAEFYESAFENANSRNEHDLVVYDDGVLLIVEAKASPPKEPMRDAEKAFIKIRDHFKSNAGLQKAFDQANSLKNRVLHDQRLTLFTKKGKLLTEIPLEDIKVIHTICVTRDDFGALGCNLDYLLDKQPDETYPWVIDIANLDSIVQAWDHLELNHYDFYDFLSQRNQLHNKVVSMDELEYVGAYLRYQGGLKGYISAKADFIPLSMEDADIFDEIYFKTLEGEKYDLKKEPLSLHRMQLEDFFGTKQNKVLKEKPNRKPRSKIQRKSRKLNRKK